MCIINSSEMSTYKLICAGRLDFGSQRSYEKVVQFFQQRSEDHYRNAILFKPEEIFNEEEFALIVPRRIWPEASEKHWRNTVKLMQYVAQFAVAGLFKVWVIKDRQLIERFFIEPESDKGVVMAFRKGRSLVHQEGKEADARAALDKAIAKFERHSMAYAYRGYVNYRLKNYDDAHYDFTKSIHLHEGNAEAWLGRARVYIRREAWSDAIADLQQALKYSIPHEPMYWEARRLKGYCHMQQKEYEEALADYKLLARRPFKEDDPNYRHVPEVWARMGDALRALGQLDEALEAYERHVAEARKRDQQPEAGVTETRSRLADEATKVAG